MPDKVVFLRIFFFWSLRSYWKVWNGWEPECTSCAQLILQNRIDQFSEYKKCITNCAIGVNDRFRLFNSIQIGYTTLLIRCGLVTLEQIPKKPWLVVVECTEFVRRLELLYRFDNSKSTCERAERWTPTMPHFRWQLWQPHTTVCPIIK